MKKLIIPFGALALLSGCGAGTVPTQHQAYYQQVLAAERSANAARLGQQMAAEYKAQLVLQQEFTRQLAVANYLPVVAPVQPQIKRREHPYLDKVLAACLEDQESAKLEPTEEDLCKNIGDEIADLNGQPNQSSPKTGSVTVNVVASTVTGSPMFSTAATGEGHKTSSPMFRSKTLPVLAPIPDTTGQTIVKVIGGSLNNLVNKAAAVAPLAILGAAATNISDSPNTYVGGSVIGGDDNTGRYETTQTVEIGGSPIE